MTEQELRNIIEAALLAAGRPLSVAQIEALFEEPQRPGTERVVRALDELKRVYSDHGVELVEVASGYRIQTRAEVAPWVSRLWEERPSRYSRALLETLALIAYRQPVTRGEIEDVRGVSVSSSILKTLLERQWIRVVGHRDLPGRPAMYGTTREFLDYFGLPSLDRLPTLAELRDLESINAELDLSLASGAEPAAVAAAAGAEADDGPPAAPTPRPGEDS
jgi:segregation and condensation protein B